MVELVSDYVADGYASMPVCGFIQSSAITDFTGGQSYLQNRLWPAVRRGTVVNVFPIYQLSIQNPESVPAVVVGKTWTASALRLNLIFPYRTNAEPSTYGDLAAAYEFAEFPAAVACNCRLSFADAATSTRIRDQAAAAGKLVDSAYHTTECPINVVHSQLMYLTKQPIPTAAADERLRIRTLTIPTTCEIRMVDTGRRKDLFLIGGDNNRPAISVSFPIGNNAADLADNRSYRYYDLFAGESMRNYQSRFFTPFDERHALGFP